jgi:hypothetical protein
MGSYPRHPEFAKLTLRILGIPMIRGGVLLLISVPMYFLGTPTKFTSGFVIATAVYLYLDLFLSFTQIQRIRKTRPTTHYLLFKSPEALISHHEQLIEEIVEDEKKRRIEDKE